MGDLTLAQLRPHELLYVLACARGFAEGYLHGASGLKDGFGDWGAAGIDAVVHNGRRASARGDVSLGRSAAVAQARIATCGELPAALRREFSRAVDQFITDDERHARILAAVTDDCGIDYFIEVVERGGSRLDLYMLLLAVTGEPDELLTALTDRSQSR